MTLIKTHIARAFFQWELFQIVGLLDYKNLL